MIGTMVCSSLLMGCSDDGGETAGIPDGATDIKDIVLTATSGACADHAGSFYAAINCSATDLNSCMGETSLTATVTITDNGDGSCSLTSNNLPNYDIVDGAFANAVAAQADETFTLRSASPAASSTEISQNRDNAAFLNGVVLDLLSAGCYDPNGQTAMAAPDDVGNVAIGCDATQYYLLDPMASFNEFGTDSHNAHTQPGGAYHYHGDPKALYDVAKSTDTPPVIGFAADGYPIFGPSTGATSCWKLKTSRDAFAGLQGEIPSIDEDHPMGMYIQDYEYDEAQAGCTLDACNGMTNDAGVYGYYVTSSYPWVMKCFTGTPDDSFLKTANGMP